MSTPKKPATAKRYYIAVYKPQYKQDLIYRDTPEELLDAAMLLHELKIPYSIEVED